MRAYFASVIPAALGHIAPQHVPLRMPVSHVCFAFSALGYSALAVFGNENGNGPFDTNFLGIPVED